jgi:DeoR/GlpR family transcriptional regulator of sugar metabolism
MKEGAMSQALTITGFGSVAERRKALLALLAERKQISVGDERDILPVSEVTVRTDFAALEREGLLQRVWGGAVLPDQSRVEGPFASRLAAQQPAKQAIAAAAVDLVADGEFLILDASSTSFMIAQLLRERRRRLTIVTNGLYTALELSANPTFSVIIPGGALRAGHGSLVGTIGEQVLVGLHTAKGFFSGQGLHLRQGLSEATLQEGQIKTLMVAHTEQVIAVVDSTKLGRTSFTSFCPIARIDQVITAGADAEQLARPFIAHGLNVQIAPAFLSARKADA